MNIPESLLIMVIIWWLPSCWWWCSPMMAARVLPRLSWEMSSITFCQRLQVAEIFRHFQYPSRFYILTQGNHWKSQVPDLPRLDHWFGEFFVFITLDGCVEKLPQDCQLDHLICLSSIHPKTHVCIGNTYLIGSGKSCFIPLSRFVVEFEISPQPGPG